MEAQADDNIWVGWIEGILNLAGFSTETKNSFPTRQAILLKIFSNSALVLISDRGGKKRMEANM